MKKYIEYVKDRRVGGGKWDALLFRFPSVHMEIEYNFSFAFQHNI